jgi:REP-associated tyrosine transposase
MPYDPEKHHRRSIRLRHYDYTRQGSYYVTICTHERRCIFGEITDATACLNDLGNIARTNWLALSQRFPTIGIDEYIIMPNHMHGIIAINETPSSTKAPTLGQIVHAFKAVTTTQIRTTYMPEFAWQGNFYERIIRKDGELNRIRQYIIDNPRRWSLKYEP